MSVDNPFSEYKEAISKILKGNVCREIILDWAEKLKIDISEAGDFMTEKRMIIRKLILHILREESNSDERTRLENILKQTEGWLSFSVKKGTGYECMFTGCVFWGPQHSNYINHITNQHFTHTHFICNFNHKCSERFNNIDALTQHVTKHSRSGTAHPPYLCVCEK